MQTFVPYDDFVKIVKCLDFRRLGKQRVEAMQVLNVLSGKSRGWNNHPCVHMWRGYEPALAMYMNYCIREWIDRGYRNTMRFDSIGFDVSDIVFSYSFKSSIYSFV